MHCSNLAEEAIQAAINDYLSKKSGEGADGKDKTCSRRCEDIEKVNRE
jgi:hypothetical protein